MLYDAVWAVVGTWEDNFGVNPNDIVRVAGVLVTDLKWRLSPERVDGG